VQKVLDKPRRRPLNFIPQCKQPFGETHMSLEAKIEALTAAVQALRAALMVTGIEVNAVRHAYEGSQEVVANAQTLKPEALTASQNADLTKYQANSAIGEQSSPTPETSSPALTYDDVKRATNNLSAAKGKEVTIGALAHFGVTRATQLTEAQWADYVAHTVALLS